MKVHLRNLDMEFGGWVASRNTITGASR